jgi:alcohol dehydrogenase
MPTQNKSVMGFNLIWLYEKADLMHQLMTQINSLALPPPFIGHRYPFDHLPAALHEFRSGKTTGKLIIEIP